MSANKSNRIQEITDAMTPVLPSAPWILTVKEEKNVEGSVLVIKERVTVDEETSKLVPSGKIYNGDLRACRDAIRYMIGQVKDDVGRPIGLQDIIDDKMAFRGDIPLDKAVGAKIALLFILHPQIRTPQRIELLAWRIERFTYEETQYWLGKVTLPTYGKRSLEWTKSGLRRMLAGQTEDMEEIEALLDQLRK